MKPTPNLSPSRNPRSPQSARTGKSQLNGSVPLDGMITKKDVIRVTVEFWPGTIPHRQLFAMAQKTGQTPDMVAAVFLDNDLRQQTQDNRLFPCEVDLVLDYAEQEKFGGGNHIPALDDRVLPVGYETKAPVASEGGAK